MPVFIAALLGGIYAALGTLVGRVLISLGIGYVTYQGVDVALTAVKNQAVVYLGEIAQLGTTVVQIAGILQVSTCLNVMFSALATRLVVAGLTSGAIKRVIYK